MGKIAPKKTKLCSKCPSEQLELEPSKFNFKLTQTSKKTSVISKNIKKKTKGGLF